MTTPFDDDAPEYDDNGDIIEGQFSVHPDVDVDGVEIDEYGEQTYTPGSNQALADTLIDQRIFLPEGATAADAIVVLQKDIPENEYGLPTFFYRVDMLPYDLSQLVQSEADAAVVELDYSEGYPTYNQGCIFWQQLPAEPMDAFLLFQRYIDQAHSIGLRQLQMLSMDERVSLAKINEYYNSYFWKARARSHDLFQVAAERKRRELRARTLENNHYNIAEQLLEQLKPTLEDPEVFKNMSAKEKIEVLRLLINIQRVSSGLPQNGNAGGVPVNPDSAMSGRQLMEEITKGVQRDDGGLGLGGGLLELMRDPNFAMRAQGVILEVRHQNDPNAGKAMKPIEDG